MSHQDQEPEVGTCQRCQSSMRAHDVHIGGGMLFLEFSCPTCKLRACWSYVGPPGISIWFDQSFLVEANAYLKLATAWRKKAFSRNDSESGFTWDMTPPPVPGRHLVAVCIDFNSQHVVLRPRAAQLESDSQQPVPLGAVQADRHTTPADAQSGQSAST